MRLTLHMMRKAYNRVVNPKDVDGPINVVIPAKDAPVVDEAILYFTGANSKILLTTCPGLVRVKAIGKRAWYASWHTPPVD